MRCFFSRIVDSSDAEITEYVTLPRLYKLNMNENLIENIDEISVMKELRELNMGQNEIVGINNVEWSAIPWLNTLDLSFNNISEIKVLEGMKKLKSLNVSKNLISGSFDFNLTSINFNGLEKFDVSQNQINDIENLKNQFEFMAKADKDEDGKSTELNTYVNNIISTKNINLKNQDLTMNLKVQKTGDRIKVELPKIFRQFEELDWENTSFGVTSLAGNVTSDGKYVTLETPMIGSRIATVVVSGGIGSGTNCVIQYEVVADLGDTDNKDDDNNNNNQDDSINVNIADGSCVEATKQMNNMSYIVVSKDTTVTDILKDVTVNNKAYKVVVKDEKAQNAIDSKDKVQTNQTIVVEGLSDEAQCKIVVKGDVTGDGTIALGDIIKLNQYRLDDNQSLTDAEFIAGNIVDDDEEINLSDILALNQYRLNNQ